MLLTALLLSTLIPVNTDSSNLYFHNSNFTADLKYLIYAHDNQIFKFNLATKENTQLTNTPGVNAHGAMPDRFHPHRVLYGIGRELWQLDVETKATKKLGEAPTTAKGLGQPSLSHDGTHAAVYFKSGDKSWEIGHIQHSPTAPLIFYTWETSGDAPQRTWLVNADGSGNRPFYFATEPAKWLTPLKEWITHEAWIPGTGDMTMIFDKYGILRVTPDGAAKVIVRGHYWHAQATLDGKQLIADDFDGRLWLIHAATGETKLLAENLRKPGEQHIHPSIDPTGQWLVVNTGKNVAVLNLRP